MLPRLLCEELCSLNPGVDRLSFSVVWKIDKDGEIWEEWFGRSIIRSCCKLTYDIAQVRYFSFYSSLEFSQINSVARLRSCYQWKRLDLFLLIYWLASSDVCATCLQIVFLGEILF